MELDEIQTRLAKACEMRSATLGPGASPGAWEVRLASGARVAAQESAAASRVIFTTHVTLPPAELPPSAPGIDLLDIARSAARQLDPLLSLQREGRAADILVSGEIHEDGFTVQEVARLLAALEAVGAPIRHAVESTVGLIRQSEEIAAAVRSAQTTLNETRGREPRIEGLLGPDAPLSPPASPRCPNPACGQPLADGTRFCSACGTPVQAAEPERPRAPVPGHCAACGGVLVPGNRFCTGCGAPVG